MPDINIVTQLTDWSIGDILAGSAPGRSARVPGNTEAVLKVLAQKGDGTKSARPFWTTVGSIIPGLATIATSGSANDLIAGTIPPLRFPALTGDVTNPVGSLATTISPNSVSNGKLSKMPPLTIKGNNSTLSSDPKDLTVADLNAMGIGSGGGGSGTVTSVGLSAPAIFTVSGSPVTAAGTLTFTLATELANSVWAGPTTGAAATPTFRSLVAADIPSLSGIYQPLNAHLTAFSGLSDALGFLHNDGSGVLTWSAAGSGSVTSVALTVPTGLSVSGSPITSAGTLAITTALSGVLKGTGSGLSAATAGSDFVAPGSITSDGITINTARLAGRTTAGSGAVEEISVGTGLTLSSGTLSATGGSGTVTSVALTVPSGFSVSGSPITGAGTLAVTTTLSGILKGTGSGIVAATPVTDYVPPGFAINSGLIQTSARILGRTTATSGAIEEISVGSAISLSSGVIGFSGGLITGLNITISSGKLAGRTTAATGSIEEISVGTGLVLSSGTLSATGGTISGTGTDNHLMRWDGTTNAQDSSSVLDDNGNIVITSASTGDVVPLTIKSNPGGTGSRNNINLDNTHGSGNFKSQLSFLSSGNLKWAIGNDSAENGTDDFWIYQNSSSDFRFQILSSGLWRGKAYTTAGLLSNDTSGNVTTATVGSGLSLSGGVLSASGGSGIGGSSGGTDTAIIIANGTGGSTVQGSVATIASNGAFVTSGSGVVSFKASTSASNYAGLEGAISGTTKLWLAAVAANDQLLTGSVTNDSVLRTNGTLWFTVDNGSSMVAKFGSSLIEIGQPIKSANFFSSTGLQIKIGGHASAGADTVIQAQCADTSFGRIFQRQSSTNNVFCGDIDANGGELHLRSNGADAVVLDTSGNAVFSGSIKTANPSGGTAAPAKIGSVVSIAVPSLALNYLQIDIGGTAYKIALLT